MRRFLEYLEAPYTLLLWTSAAQTQNKDGLLGPNSIMVVYMEPLGYGVFQGLFCGV